MVLEKEQPSGYHFHAVGDTYAELPVVIQRATTFVLACMDTLAVGICQTHDRSMEEQGRKVFEYVNNFSILSSTTESVTENAKRAHL